MASKKTPAKKAKKEKIVLTEEQLAEKKAKEKLRNKKMMWGGGAFVVALLLFLIFAPRNGSTQYGICKTLVEMNEPYPDQIKIHALEDDEQTVRIYYSSIGTFGEHRSNDIRCIFKTDKDGNVLYELDKVDLNGKKKYDIESPDYIKRFNAGVDAIVESKPDLEIPYSDLDDITQYWELERR